MSPNPTEPSLPMGPNYAACLGRAHALQAQYVIHSATMLVMLERGFADGTAPPSRLAHYRTVYDVRTRERASRDRVIFTELYGTNEHDGDVQRWDGPEQERIVSGAQSSVYFDAEAGDTRTLITGATLIYPNCNYKQMACSNDGRNRKRCCISAVSSMWGVAT